MATEALGADGLARQRRLIARLAAQMRRAWPRLRCFETHISWVLVAGGYAYKFKKAVRFDVLDYSTLAARLHCCQEELRLNRRLAPQLYLNVVEVGGSAEAPRLGGDGAVLDYAVRMRAFPQGALWQRRLAAGRLNQDDIDGLAALLARFHGAAARAPAASDWGSAAALARAAQQDLATVAGLCGAGPAREQCARLGAWLAAQHGDGRSARFTSRKAGGWVRECHGDLHCGNILTIAGQVQVFDCIEFNDELRWIDVLHDLAFIVMDLRCHGRPALAARLLSAYLEASGTAEGLALLAYYQTMRALVRCKVFLLRAAAAPAAEAQAASAMAQRYLDFACAGLAPGRAGVIVMHGYSGSGKSHCAGLLAAALGAVRIRSDVERKRLRGSAPGQRLAAPPGQGIYGAADTDATYARLLMLARQIVAAGLPVVVDAAFLQAGQRAPFAALAAQLGLPYAIVAARASPATMMARLRARSGDASDAGPALLPVQLAAGAPLTPAERRAVRQLDTESLALEQTIAALAATLKPEFGELRQTEC